MEFNANPLGLEHSDHGGAVELARRLRQHWLSRGFIIKTDIKTIELSKRSTIYCVRSNLQHGLPPKESRILAVSEAA